MVRHTDADDADESTADHPAEVTAEVADEYADVPTAENFGRLRSAVEDEDGITTFGRDTSLTATGWSVVEACESFGFDVYSFIDFDDRDVIVVEWSTDDIDASGDVPSELCRVVADADLTSGDRSVVFKPDPGSYTANIRVERGVVTGE